MILDSEILKEIISKYQGAGRRQLAEAFGFNEQTARAYISVIDNIDLVNNLSETDVELIEENKKYKKQTQRYQDLNRIERKSFRENSRVENAVVSYGDELLDIFDKYSLNINTVFHDNGHVKENENLPIGVVQISDTHFNELVELLHNRFDFTIASKRLQKYISKCKVQFNAKGVKTVLLTLTGDLLNSDRRLDELLSNATNRSKATFLAVEILINVILDLNKDYNVNIAAVVGNESRVNKDLGWVHQVASDSYDLTIYSILDRVLKNKEGINFLGGDQLQTVVNVNGYNWLLIHGHQSEFGNPQKGVTKVVRQYADKGIIIRYVIFGHIHEACIADMYSRSSSIVGANAYSENGLLLTSRASQNMHIAYSNGEIDTTKIDLQETKGYDGYDITNELEAYNAKSASKIHTGTTVMQIVI